MPIYKLIKGDLTMSLSNTLSLVANPNNYQATCGTSLQGYIRVRYTDLLATFGKPGIGDEYKVQVEWRLEFTDHTTDKTVVATIYDWKQGDTYLGEGNGTPVQDITLWNVGGYSIDALYAVSEWLHMHDIPHDGGGINNFRTLVA